MRKVSPVFLGTRYDFPLPDLCADCRFQQLGAHINEYQLFQNTCYITGKPVISIYHPDTPHKVVENSVWWSDDFDARVYGRPVDFSIPFFAQFAQLSLAVPRMNLNAQELENSPYVNAAGKLKNCHMVIATGTSQDTLYSSSSWYLRDCVECISCHNCETCYQALYAVDCYQCFFVQEVDACRESSFLYDCTGLSHCIACVGLSHVAYHIWNTPVTPEEYTAFVQDMASWSYEEFEAFQSKFQEMVRQYPRKYFRGKGSEDASGNHLDNAHSVARSYDLKNCENIFDSYFLLDAKDCVSYYKWGGMSELMYMCVGVGAHSHGMAFCSNSWRNDAELYYCDGCLRTKHCFGCIGLKDAEYCVLNKQYTKEEYEELVPKLIQHMIEHNEWGRFFPMDISPFPYNTSNAALYFPLTREECTTRGLHYGERLEANVGEGLCCNVDHPEAGDAERICSTVWTCQITGRPYRIIPQEFAFHLRHSLPLPRCCPDARRDRLFAMRTPYRLFERGCVGCGSVVESAYAEEAVLCGACYAAKRV